MLSLGKNKIQEYFILFLCLEVMKLFWIVFAILFLIIVLLLLMDIEINAAVNNGDYEVNVVLYRLFKIDLKPKIEKGKKGIKLDTETYDKFIKSYRELYHRVKKLLKKMSMKFSLNIEYGLSSSDKTALLFGFSSFLISIIDTYFLASLNKFERKYNINPIFNKEKFNYDLKINLSTRAIHLVAFGIGLFLKRG